LTTDKASTCAIGLDVGGTKIAAGIVLHDSGEVLFRQQIPTRAERGGSAVLDDALRLATGLLDEARHSDLSVAGIGVAVCELVDVAGNVTSSHTIGWQGMPVGRRFSRLAPTVIESDARAPALAEALYGAGRGRRLFVYVTVGTGISYSLVQDGLPYAGAHGNALVLASMPLTTTCTQCGARLHPVLEEFAAGPALVERYNEQADATVTGGEAVLAAAQRGNPIARDIVTTAGEALGVTVGFLVNVLDPQAVIVGGGLGLAGGLYWQSFLESTRTHIYADVTRNLPIQRAELGVDAGLIGAAACLFRPGARPGRPHIQPFE
jgi:glucokinase